MVFPQGPNGTFEPGPMPIGSDVTCAYAEGVGGAAALVRISYFERTSFFLASRVFDPQMLVRFPGGDDDKGCCCSCAARFRIRFPGCGGLPKWTASDLRPWNALLGHRVRGTRQNEQFSPSHSCHAKDSCAGLQESANGCDKNRSIQGGRSKSQSCKNRLVCR